MYLNELYKDKEVRLGKEYEVDFELEGNQVDNCFVDELSQYNDEFGGDISHPIVAIKNIGLLFTDIKITKANIIFEHNGIKYIKKFATKVLKEDFQSRPMMNIDLIGKVTSDGFNNKGVIEIMDLEFK